MKEFFTVQAEIYDINYNQLVYILGTTHFTRHSFFEAVRAVNKLKPTDLAIELDLERFRTLNNDCATCPENRVCTNKCEFMGATEALGNVDANIWLIDMSRHQFSQRAHMFASRATIWRILIDERDILMAARLAWIASEGLRTQGNSNILAMVGAAHVNGIRALLNNPMKIKQNLQRLNLEFTPPTLVRRIQVVGD